MTLQNLCDCIELQQEMNLKVMMVAESPDFEQFSGLFQDLTIGATAESAYKELNEILKDDEEHIQMLTCQLMCATKVYEKYKEMGISERIYVDTMKCFTRFIRECREKTGKYAFDRAWWTYRQVSMSLFRIGELEYELAMHEGKKIIEIHIPSDVCFAPDRVDASFHEAKEFIQEYYPEYVGCEWVCDSWLLYPGLKDVLKPDSNILSFQNRFEIRGQDNEARDVMEWLFQVSAEREISSLPEHTSLQRNVKQLMLQGGNIGTAFGVLKKM